MTNLPTPAPATATAIPGGHVPMSRAPGGVAAAASSGKLRAGPTCSSLAARASLREAQSLPQLALWLWKATVPWKEARRARAEHHHCQALPELQSRVDAAP